MRILAVVLLLLVTTPATPTALLAFVEIGDSIIAQTGSRDIGSYISIPAAWTYTNAGGSGQNTTQIAARFATDAIAPNPYYVLIEGGVNDVFQGASTNTVVTNWTTMLAACQTAHTRPVMILILPWTNGTNVQNTQIDTINTQLIALAPTYSAIVVDARCTVGQFRVGGAVGNCWDIQSQYVFADGLGVHYNAAGSAAIASVISLPAIISAQVRQGTLRGAAVVR